jgi:type I restriction enzyme S subunit
MSPDWPLVPIGEIVLGIWDGLHATPKPAEDGPIFLGIRNVSEDGHLMLEDVRHIAEEDFPKWTRRIAPEPGDIVFSYEATLNLYGLIPQGFRGCLGRRLALIRVNPVVADNRFLFHSFFGREWRDTIQRNLILGATVDRIPLIRFSEFPVRLPSLPVQRKIASILSSFDDLIENNLRRIKILEEMAQGLYREWFVHFHFPGHADVPMVVSAVGEMPVGWRVGRLADACELIMGQSPKSEFYNDEGEGLPFHQGVTDFGERFPTSRVFCTAMNRLAEAGDVLLSVRAPVGRINVSNDRIVIGRGLAAIRSNSGDQWFLFHQLRDRFTEEDTMGGGTIFKAVTTRDVEDIEFLYPTPQTIKAFEAQCAPIEDQIENLMRGNLILRRMRDLLLPKLVSGELDVSELGIPVPGEHA